VEQNPKTDTKGPRKKVQRYSPDRLLREKIKVPAATTVSAERHNGRVMLRFEMVRDEG
jgi:hypothetical protein